MTDKSLNLIKCDSPEDIPLKGTEILIWDGAHFYIDYVEYDVETGTDYMANHTQPTHWCELIPPTNDR